MVTDVQTCLYQISPQQQSLMVQLKIATLIPLHVLCSSKPEFSRHIEQIGTFHMEQVVNSGGLS